MDDHQLRPYIVELPASASAEEVKTAVHDLLQQNDAIDAVLFADFNLAFTGLAALRQLKKKIPDQIAVIGFDDNESFQLFAPAITAVVEPMDEMVESILQCIAGHTGEPNTKQHRSPIILPTRMVMRSSTRTIRSLPSLSTTINK